ncbi:MAG TPA: hypothetical protein DD716_06760 [Thiomicrospira sp.]|jgi:hypothetical protein|nr:hypothetical protein [Thiomicrospira sp.]
MLLTLFMGMLTTAGLLGAIWLGFITLRKLPKFANWNSREANKFMLQLTIVLYFTGVVATIYLML